MGIFGVGQQISTLFSNEKSIYFGRALKSMYGITNSGNLFSDKLTEWLIQSGFICPKWQISTYYEYAPYGTQNFVIANVDDSVYWYTYKLLENGL